MAASLDPQDFPPGTVGILSSDLSRYAWFAQSVVALAMPPDTHIVWVTGMWVASSVNRLIRSMQPESAFLMILSDDHKFESDLLLRLLAHDVDIVAPLCALRSPPHDPSIFHETNGVYRGYAWTELDGQHGLLPVPTMGGPGVVIKRHVLDGIRDPWFVCEPSEHPNEDLGFFTRCRQLGWQPHVDLATAIGHMTTMVVYPEQDAAGRWGIRLWNRVNICQLPAYDRQCPGLGFSEAK